MQESNNTFKSLILGVFIGLAIIIPGLSGAQIAIIFKLYDKLMASLAHIFKKKSLLFLIPLAIGGLIGFIGGFFTIRYVLEISMIAVVFFFAGLMLGGMPSVLDEVKGQKFKNIYFLNVVIGFIIPVLISFISIYFEIDMSYLVNNPPLYFYFVAILIGVVLSLTQLIPGLSATSILLSFGLYKVLLDNVSLELIFENHQLLLIYILIVVGALIGVITISKFINRCLINYKTGFYYLIIGLCIGNLFVMFYNPEMYEVYLNPGSHFVLEIIIGSILFVVGTILIYMIYRYTKNKEIRD